MIKHVFLELAARYATVPGLANELWQEIEISYTEPGRHYHTLDHLQHLLGELQPLQLQIADWETLVFSLCYHDVVYDVAHNMVANDNEERSAEFAEKQLSKMGYPAERIAQCKLQIMATKTHVMAPDADTNFLTDADLSILGQPWEVYAVYRSNIRKEYHIYPDNIFLAGRKKMLEHFLRMAPLFKTAHFRKLYEERAHENLRKEYRLLQA